MPMGMLSPLFIFLLFFTAVLCKNLEPKAKLEVIDLSPLRSEQVDSSKMSNFIEQIAYACETRGMFYITGHGLSVPERSSILAASKSFFSQSLEDKLKIEVDKTKKGFTRGYVRPGGESGSHLLEVKEAFSYGYNWDPQLIPANPLQGPNIWPTGWSSSHPERLVLESWYSHAVRIATLISQALSLVLTGNKYSLEKFCKGGDTISLMRVFHYDQTLLPKEQKDKSFDCVEENNNSNECYYDDNDRIGSSPHTDWGFVTLILQDDVGGLEAYFNDDWYTIDHIEDTLFVNLGDYVNLFTSGKFKSPLHRVKENEKERFSLVFFNYPNFNAEIPTISEIDSKNNSVENISLFASQDGVEQYTPEQLNNNNNNNTINNGKSFGEYILQKWSEVTRQ